MRQRVPLKRIALCRRAVRIAGDALANARVVSEQCRGMNIAAGDFGMIGEHGARFVQAAMPDRGPDEARSRVIAHFCAPGRMTG